MLLAPHEALRIADKAAFLKDRILLRQSKSARLADALRIPGGPEHSLVASNIIACA